MKDDLCLYSADDTTGGDHRSDGYSETTREMLVQLKDDLRRLRKKGKGGKRGVKKTKKRVKALEKAIKRLAKVNAEQKKLTWQQTAFEQIVPRILDCGIIWLQRNQVPYDHVIPGKRISRLR